MAMRRYRWTVTVTDLTGYHLGTYGGASTVDDPSTTEDDVSRSVCADILHRAPHLAEHDLHFQIHIQPEN